MWKIFKNEKRLMSGQISRLSIFSFKFSLVSAILFCHVYLSQSCSIKLGLTLFCLWEKPIFTESSFISQIMNFMIRFLEPFE